MLLLFFFRHAILEHAFKVSISEKTKSSVELEIGHLNYDIYNSTVTLIGSELTFKNIFVNKEKTIELSEFKFDELNLVDLSIFSLLFKHELLASKFIVNKPSFWFQENNNPKPFKERPKEILKSLKQHPDLLGSLVIKVDEVEITHGKIDLTSIIGDDENKGTVEFRLLLKDINTQTESILNEESFLFAKHHFFELSKFNYSLPNGDEISFDSLVFGSDYDEIAVSNLGVRVIDTSKYSQIKSINANVEDVILFGVDLINLKQFHDIEIDSLKILDADVNIVKNKAVEKRLPESVNTDNTHHSFYFDVTLAKLIFDNINITALETENDTIIYLKKMDFHVGDIVVDSSVIASKKPKYDSSSVHLFLEEFLFNDKETGVKASFNNMLLDEKKKILSLSNIFINDNQLGDHSYLINSDFLEIYGISLDDQLKKRKMKLGLLVSNPEVNINLEKFKKRSNNRNTSSFENIIIDNVEITKGLFHVYEKGKLKLDIAGFNLNWDSINFSDPQKIKSINTDNLNFNLNELQFELFEKHTSISSGYINITNSELQINKLHTNVNTPGQLKSNFYIHKIFGQGTNIEKLISDNQLQFELLRISKPIVKANIELSKSTSSKSNNSENEDNDYTINVEDFELVDGKIEIELEHKNTTFIKSDISIETDNIIIDNIHNPSWIHNIDWDINLENTLLEASGYKLVFDKLTSDKKNETLLISNLKLTESDTLRIRKRTEIENLTFSEIKFEGFNYSRIIEKQTPIVRLAIIKGANIELDFDKRIPKIKKDTSKNISKEKLPFELDELTLNELSVKVKMQDCVSVSYLNVGQLDFNYRLDSSINLIDDIEYFNINDISFSDTIKNTYLGVKSVDFNNPDNHIEISDINSNSIKKEVTGSHHDIVIPQVGLDKIFISHSYPIDIDLGNINVKEIHADIVSEKKEEKNSKPQKAELPKFLRSISVDNINVDDFDFYHTSLSDTTPKKMSLIDLAIDIDSIKVDSTILASSRYDYAKSVSLFIGKNKFITKDSLYNASVKNLTYNFSNNSLIVDSLLLIPRFDDDEFFKRAVYQISRTKLVAGQIVCNDFRLNSFIKDKKIHIGAVGVSGLVADMYKNKMYAIKPGTYKKMPQEEILGINQIIIIDSLVTYDAIIKFKEIKEKALEPGALFLDRFNLKVYNINNDLPNLDSTSSIKAVLDARFMGQADLHVQALFYTLSPTNEFSVTGFMDKLEFSEVNSLTENLVGVTLSRGSGSLVIPEIKGNSASSEGDISFKYSKLKIELYDREKAQVAKGLAGSMAGLLLNDIFIKSNNPGFLGKTRPGEVYFKRDTQKSIVNYIWKSILSGLMSTMGYNNKEQRQEQRALRKALNRSSK